VVAKNLKLSEVLELLSGTGIHYTLNDKILLSDHKKTGISTQNGTRYILNKIKTVRRLIVYQTLQMYAINDCSRTQGQFLVYEVHTAFYCLSSAWNNCQP